MIILTLISPQNCKNCTETMELIATLKKEYPNVEVKHIDAWSPEGETLIVQHGIMASPGILLNDTLLAAGPISEDKLRQALKEYNEQLGK